MEARIERGAQRLDALHAEALQLREELLPHHLDALQKRLRRLAARLSRAWSRGLPRRVDRAIEVVDDFDQAHQHVAPAALGVLRQLLAHPRAGVLEFLRRLAVLPQVFLRLLLGVRSPALELLDVCGLLASLAGTRSFTVVAAGPPAPIYYFDRVVVFVRHIANWVIG